MRNTTQCASALRHPPLQEQVLHTNADCLLCYIMDVAAVVPLPGLGELRQEVASFIAYTGLSTVGQYLTALRLTVLMIHLPEVSVAEAPG